MLPVHFAGEATGEQQHQSFSLGKQSLDLRTSFNRSLLPQLRWSLGFSKIMYLCTIQIRGSLQGIKMLSAVLS